MSAYNAGVEGAMVWSPGFVADIFDIAAQVSNWRGLFNLQDHGYRVQPAVT